MLFAQKTDTGQEALYKLFKFYFAIVKKNKYLLFLNFF